MARFVGVLVVSLIDNPEDELWFALHGDTNPDPKIAMKELQDISDRRNANPLMEHETSRWMKIIHGASEDEVNEWATKAKEHNPGRNPNDLFPGEPARILHSPVFQTAYHD